MTEESDDVEQSEDDGMKHINSVLASGPLLLEVSVDSKIICMEVVRVKQ